MGIRLQPIISVKPSKRLQTRWLVWTGQYFKPQHDTCVSSFDWELFSDFCEREVIDPYLWCELPDLKKNFFG